MAVRSRLFLFSLTTIAVLLLSAMGPIAVYADDGSTPQPVAEETQVVETPTGNERSSPDEEQAAEPAETPIPTETASASTEGETPEVPPDATPTVAPTDETAIEPPVSTPTDEPVDETPAPNPTDEPVSVPEILDQVPEGTELVALNDEGEPEPLATEDAAEILTEGDPMWCPENVAPGGAGCTPGYGSFTQLIAELTNGTYSGNGTIWVQHNYNSLLDVPAVVFDGASGNLANLGNVTVQGGWSGQSNDTTVTGTSTLMGVSMTFTGWSGDITINDLVFNGGSNAEGSLTVKTEGDIELNNVTVMGNTSGDGVHLEATDGDIKASDVLVTANGGNGVFATTKNGNINLTDIYDIGSGGNGVYAYANIKGDITLTDGDTMADTLNGFFAYTADGDITLTDLLTLQSDGNGVSATAHGDLKLTNVTATGNGLQGIFANGKGGMATLSDITAMWNDSNGLAVTTDGDISLKNVSVSGSKSLGAYLNNCLWDNTTQACLGSGNIVVTNSGFYLNDWSGLMVETSGTVSLDGVTASDNDSDGLVITADQEVSLKQVTASDNGDAGIDIISEGKLTLTDVTANGNDFGLQALSLADIVLSNMTANGNQTFGAYLDNCAWNGQSCDGSGSIFVSGGSFDQNKDFLSGGLGLETHGNVYFENVHASGNAGEGADIFADGDVSIKDSQFDKNGVLGLYIDTLTNVSLDNVTADGNGDTGAVILADGKIVVQCSQFNSNRDTGLAANFASQLALLSVTSELNGVQGVDIGPDVLDVVIREVACGPAAKGKPAAPLYPVLICPASGSTVALSNPNGDQVIFENLCNYQGELFFKAEGDLPVALLEGNVYLSGLHANVRANGAIVDPLPPGAKFTISFLIPEGTEAADLAILWWSGSAWVDLGGQPSGDGYFQVVTEKVGTFVLVAK